MRRPRRWLFVLTVLVFFLLGCEAARPASLVYPKGKTTTTTTTPSTTTAEEKEKSESAPESVPEGPTKAPLTGIPQIDYIWDPNLPRELNGYNLTDYPFFSTVPPHNEIEFKCDGLHDGFYASIPYKCQVYHHCLYGTRYDFLCANFTAFDQRTFICHFASEVDCDNSPKYYSRNDALYKATTTTTTTTTTVAPPPTVARPLKRRRPLRRRRPQYDYYDDAEYADEYYEDEPRSRGQEPGRRKRPRPAQRRPEYDEYDDERYDRRPADTGRRDDDDYDRRPKDRPRPGGRRRPALADDNRRPVDDRVAGDRKKLDDRRPVVDDPILEDNGSDVDAKQDDRRPYERPKAFRGNRPNTRNNDGRRTPEDKRVGDDRRVSTDDRRPVGDRRGVNDDRDYDEDDTRSYDRPRINRPDDRRNFRDGAADEPRDEVRKPAPKDDPIDEQPKVRPAGGSLYSRPRTPPKIRRPVPINQRNKFDYKTTTSKAPAPLDDEYYDEYEDEDPKYYADTRSRNRGASKVEPIEDPVKDVAPVDAPAPIPSTAVGSGQAKPPRRNFASRRPYEDTDQYDSGYKNPRPPVRSRYELDDKAPSGSVKQAVRAEDEYYDDYDSDLRRRGGSNRDRDSDVRERVKPKDNFRTESKPREASSRYPAEVDSKESSAEERDSPRQVVRVVKRPFLPSRGGSPYLPRGLQPLGSKSTPTTDRKEYTDSRSRVSSVESDVRPLRGNTRDDLEEDDYVPPSKYKESQLSGSRVLEQTAPIVRVNEKVVKTSDDYESDPLPVRTRGSIRGKQDSYRTTTPASDAPNPFFQPGGPRTTLKPKIPESSLIKQNLADVNDNDEYDVTLNDALNPTLPNLTPSRQSPSGFVLSKSPDYGLQNVRSRYYSNDPSYSSSDFSYQIRSPEAITPSSSTRHRNYNNRDVDYIY